MPRLRPFRMNVVIGAALAGLLLVFAIRGPITASAQTSVLVEPVPPPADAGPQTAPVEGPGLAVEVPPVVSEAAVCCHRPRMRVLPRRSHLNWPSSKGRSRW